MATIASTASLVPALSSRFIQKWADRIRAGSCVLLLGPGASVPDDEHELGPLTSRLARQLAESNGIKEDRRLGDPSNLRAVAQFLVDYGDRDRRRSEQLELAYEAQEFYQRYAKSTTRLHECLAMLPFRLCITTSPDDFMVNAFKAAGKNPQRETYRFNGAAGPEIPEATVTRPLVYHLYGHPSEPSSLVLTESDLIEFLVKIGAKAPPLPHQITGSLGIPSTTFLFIGFGFQNWYLRVLLHVLSSYGHGSGAAALEDQSFFRNPEKEQTVGFFAGGRWSIDFPDLDWATFAEQLSGAFKQVSETVPAVDGSLPADRPEVFLCYSRQDEDAADRLRGALLERGLTVWQDKQNLRGGDQWDQVVMKVIDKQVDYVVVAQSQAMFRTIRSYCSKEINRALAQQEQYFGYRFLIPVMIDECEIYDKLKHLLAIDVRSDAGVDSLAAAILDDWRKRLAARQGRGDLARAG